MEKDPGQMLNIKHTAALLDMSEPLVRLLCLRHDRGEEGGLPSIKVGGRGDRRLRTSELGEVVEYNEKKRTTR